MTDEENTDWPNVGKQAISNLSLMYKISTAW